MASRILAARDALYSTITATGWTGYKELTNEAKELTTTQSFILTPADQSKLTFLSNGTIKITGIQLLFAMLIEVGTNPTTSLETLFNQFEAWFDAGTVQAKMESADFFKTTINNKLYYGITAIIEI